MEFRSDGRKQDQLRPIEIELDFVKAPLGSVLFKQGDTWVLAAMDLIEGVPHHMKGADQGWLTAEYSLMPSSTSPRSRREARTGRQTGRTVEIQRIIGRSLRAAVDLTRIPDRTLVIDCDVLQADGGTRTASITASSVALAIGCHRMVVEEGFPENPMKDFITGISVGIVQNEYLLDLDYREDSQAMVDLNLAMAGNGNIIEIQGTGEGRSFSSDELEKLIELAIKGKDDLINICSEILSKREIYIPR